MNNVPVFYFFSQEDSQSEATTETNNGVVGGLEVASLVGVLEVKIKSTMLKKRFSSSYFLKSVF